MKKYTFICIIILIVLQRCRCNQHFKKIYNASNTKIKKIEILESKLIDSKIQLYGIIEFNEDTAVNLSSSTREQNIAKQEPYKSGFIFSTNPKTLTKKACIEKALPHISKNNIQLYQENIYYITDDQTKYKQIVKVQDFVPENIKKKFSEEIYYVHLWIKKENIIFLSKNYIPMLCYITARYEAMVKETQKCLDNGIQKISDLEETYEETLQLMVDTQAKIEDPKKRRKTVVKAISSINASKEILEKISESDTNSKDVEELKAKLDEYKKKLIDQQQENKAQQGKMKLQEEEIENNIKNIGKLKLDNNNKDEIINQLENNLEILKDDNTKYNKLLVERNDNIAYLNELNQQLNQEKNELLIENKDNIEDLNKKLNEIQSKFNGKNKEKNEIIAQLRSTIDEIKKQNEELKKIGEENKNDIKKAKETMQEQIKIIEDLHKENEQLKEQLSIIDTSNENLEKKIKDLHNQINNLEDNNNKQVVDEKNEIIEQLKEEIKKYKEYIKNSKEKNEQEIENLNKKFDEQTALLEQEKRAHNKTNLEKEMLAKVIEDLKEEKVANEQKYNQELQDRILFEQKNKKLEEDIVKYQEELDKLKNEFSTIGNVLGIKEADMEYIIQAILADRNIIQSLNFKIEKMQLEKPLQAEELKKKAESELNKVIKAMKKQLKKKDKDIQEHIKAYEDMNTRLLNEKREIMDKKIAYQKSNQKLSSKILTLKNKINDQKKQLEKVKKELRQEKEVRRRAVTRKNENNRENPVDFFRKYAIHIDTMKVRIKNIIDGKYLEKNSIKGALEQEVDFLQDEIQNINKIKIANRKKK